MAYCACTSGSPDPGQLLRRQVGIGPGKRVKVKAGGARKVRFQESLAQRTPGTGPLQRTHPTGDGYALTTEEPAQAKAAPGDVQQLGGAAYSEGDAIGRKAPRCPASPV